MKREFWYYEPKKILDHTRKKIAIEKKPIDKLNYRKSIYSKKGTLSYSYNSRKRKNIVTKVPTIEL